MAVPVSSINTLLAVTIIEYVKENGLDGDRTRDPLFFGHACYRLSYWNSAYVQRIHIKCCRISKISSEVWRIDNFRALARKLSFLATELDIFYIRQHYVRILLSFNV